MNFLSLLPKRNHLMKTYLYLFLIILLFTACTDQSKDPSAYEAQAYNPKLLHGAVEHFTDVMVHDIVSPPVASRFYAYPIIAAYEALITAYPGQLSLAGQLQGLESSPQPDTSLEICFPLASLRAYFITGKAMLFSEDSVDIYAEKIYQGYRRMGVADETFQNSIAFGDAVAGHILEWADQDLYKETRTFERFTVTTEVGRWQPTPPDYMEPIEPHWNEIRTMVIDSAQQFAPNPPTPFDVEKSSRFFKETMEVYDAVAKASQEDSAIAAFWDCNPYVSHHAGHVMFATKKITPGGHWQGITAIACQKKGLDFMESLEAYVWTSIALFDGFISCWDEKYRSELIRPETVINEHIDPEWEPLLQTPPFPEHTSGHSVISSAAATVLTHVMGDNFAFVDTTETEYGLPPRSFNSFLDASDEAAISRLYGGIHYMPAITEGVKQGKAVGALIIQRLKTRKEAFAGM